MYKLLVWLIYALVFACGAWVLVANPGFVSITWFGYVVETSVAFCFGLILALILAVHLILFPFRWIRWIKNSFEKRRFEKVKDLSIKILSNILCNNLADNAELIEKLQKYDSSDADLILMLKALSKTDSAIYKQMSKNPQTAQAGWQGLINEHIGRGEIIKASEEVEKLLEKDPKKEWILKEAFNLFTLNKEWKKALSCLETLRKIKAVSEKDYIYQKAVLLIELGKGWDAFKLCPALPAAALEAVKEKPKKAERIYFDSWKEQPSFDVYYAYLKLYLRENSLAQYKRVLKLCENNPNAKLNFLVTAEAAINAKLWSEAKKELNAYLASYPMTVNVAIKMAQIEFNLNHNIHEAQKWIDRMSGLNPSSNYVCTHCGYKTNIWRDSCPTCNTFAGLKQL
ncbi:MAG: hypothetical protein J6P93_03410 [Alphaproteobacteria bacterium]|nr:hypothetical protein [Alphaproteobacteria bacterium]